MVKTLAVSVAEVKTKKLSNTLHQCARKGTWQPIFPATVAEMKAKTIGGTLRDLEAKALVKKTVQTPQEVKVRIMPTY